MVRQLRYGSVRMGLGSRGLFHGGQAGKPAATSWGNEFPLFQPVGELVTPGRCRAIRPAETEAVRALLIYMERKWNVRTAQCGGEEEAIFDGNGLVFRRVPEEAWPRVFGALGFFR